MLKKFLILSMVLVSMIFGTSLTVDAKTSNSVELNAAPQWQKNKKNNRRWRSTRITRARVVTRTRFVYINGRRYREIWQYKYLPNGRVERRLLGRTRVR